MLLLLILILHVLTLQETGPAGPVFLLLHSVALSLAFSRLQRIFQAKLKNTSACSWLHMHIVVVVVSISPETDSENKH